MVKIGNKLPDFSIKATVSNDLASAFTTVNNKSFPGKWLVLFSWPKDFTFVCPTEIAEFGKLNSEFADRDAQILGLSTDSEFVHLAWRKAHDDLRQLPFPMLADVKRDLCTHLGILDEQEGVAQRATFIVDLRASFVSFMLLIYRSVEIRAKSFVS